MTKKKDKINHNHFLKACNHIAQSRDNNAKTHMNTENKNFFAYAVSILPPLKKIVNTKSVLPDHIGIPYYIYSLFLNPHLVSLSSAGSSVLIAHHPSNVCSYFAF